MIQFTCPNCQSTVRAKLELAGQTRKCPKCGNSLAIPATPPQEVQAEVLVDQEVESLPEALAFHPPERLDRHSHYWIYSPAQFLASWENNGRGWQLKTASGTVNAARNRDKLPAEGDFRLVELRLTATETGHRLEHIVSFRLARRWALNNLAKGDDDILRAITGPGALSREQKNLVRAAIKDRFMREVWEKAENVLEYLGNADYHSPGA